MYFFEKFNCTGDNVKKSKNIQNLLRYLRNKTNLYLSSIFFFFTIFLKILFCANECELLKRQIYSRNGTMTFYISYFLNHIVYANELYRFYVFLAKDFLV